MVEDIELLIRVWGKGCSRVLSVDMSQDNYETCYRN